MFKRNSFVLIMACALILISISSVCASDDFTNASHNQSSVDVLSQIGSFDDLEKDIGNLNPGDVYNVSRDYAFDNQSGDINNGGINIAVDNVTINGNGHVIDGSYKSALFTVTANNVKILNLTFVNAKYSGFSFPVKGEYENGPYMSRVISEYTFDVSPICWIGDNGLISDCVFSNNTAINGGALTWMGSNGVIKNNLFLDNVAGGVGGAIYVMMGANNTIANNVFRNSTSKLLGDAIYLECKSQNTSFSNCSCDDEVYIVDGNNFKISAEYLMYSYYSYVADRWIDLIPVLFKSLMCGVISFDDDCNAYVQYVENTGDLTFSVMRNFPEFNITYQKNYAFTKTEVKDIFESLIHDNYKNNLILTKNLNVTNKKEYESACRCDREIISNNEDFINIIGPDLLELAKDNRFYYGDIVFILNVIFAPGSVFQSNAQWSDDNGFDVINIIGNGAKIKASSGDRDENKWIDCESDHVYIINDLTVEGFNNAIVNRGGCFILNNVHMNHNRMDYIRDRDDGAAILNIAGVVICNNCTFTNNYAKYGGAIYNQGFLNLTNCIFKGNTGYGEGDDVLNVGDGIVYVNGAEIKSTKGVVTYTSTTHMVLLSVFFVSFTILAVAAGVGVILLISPLISGAAFMVIAAVASLTAVGLVIAGGAFLYSAIAGDRE